MKNEYVMISATSGAYCGGLGISADECPIEEAYSVAEDYGYDLDRFYIDVRDTF